MCLRYFCSAPYKQMLTIVYCLQYIANYFYYNLVKYPAIFQLIANLLNSPKATYEVTVKVILKTHVHRD
jgi:hypothetical protein